MYLHIKANIATVKPGQQTTEEAFYGLHPGQMQHGQAPVSRNPANDWGSGQESGNWNDWGYGKESGNWWNESQAASSSIHSQGK
jgi:hypothetical protein